MRVTWLVVVSPVARRTCRPALEPRLGRLSSPPRAPKLPGPVRCGEDDCWRALAWPGSLWHLCTVSLLCLDIVAVSASCALASSSMLSRSSCSPALSNVPSMSTLPRRAQPVVRARRRRCAAIAPQANAPRQMPHSAVALLGLAPARLPVARLFPKSAEMDPITLASLRRALGFLCTSSVRLSPTFTPKLCVHFFRSLLFLFFLSLLCSSGHTAALFIDERRTSLHVRAPRERLTPEASFSAVADELRSALSSASTYRPFSRTPFAAGNPAFSLVTEANVHSHSGTTVASLWNTWHFFRAHSGGS